MHIAIIGSGISGLALYLWLQKLGLTDAHTVTIYEARASFPTLSSNASDPEISNSALIGGALGLSPVGLRVLRRLDPALEREVLEAGHWMGKWKMSNARGWVLGENEVSESGGGVLVGREVFWRCLKRRVPSEAVVGGRKVVEVFACDPKQSARCKVAFHDGSEIEADLVVGCDGVWSKVRTAVLGEEVKPVYQGLTGVGGFVPSTRLQGVSDGEMNVVFGANGFFGYGYSSSEFTNPRRHGSEAAWWSTYSLADCPKDWRSIDREDAKSQLLERHRKWKNQVVQSIMEDVEVDSVYPTFTTPDLPTWSRGGCVIVGDAAHALQPSSGQGASMALEDCEALAMLLAHYQDQGHDGWLLATKLYADLRIPRLQLIRKEAESRGAMKQEMGLFKEMLMYLFIWLSCKTAFFTRFDRQLGSYDVPTEVCRVIEEQSGASSL